MITEYTEVISPRRLRAAGPLDWKYVVANLTARDAIPNEDRYEGMQVFVEGDTVYILQGGITNGDWIKVTTGELAAANVTFDNSSTTIVTATEVQTAIEQLDANILGGIQYKGTFDPNNPPTPAPKDGDSVNFNNGDLFVVDAAGFWNFTTGDQTPDSGTDNVANLVVGDRLFANPSIIWEVVGNVDQVTSVFGRVGNVIAQASDYDAVQVDYDNSGSGLVATNVQAAIDEVKQNADAAGTVTGAIQIRKASGVLDADDQFFWDSTRKNLVGLRGAAPSFSATPLASLLIGEELTVQGAGAGTMNWNIVGGSVNTYDNGGTGRGFNDSIFVGTGNTVRIANGAFGVFASIMWGESNLIEPGQSGNYVYSLIGGTLNTSRNSFQLVGGLRSDVKGLGAVTHAEGDITNRIFADGRFSAVLASKNTTGQILGHGANAENSVILGTQDGNIPSDSPRSAIIGADAIKARATTPNTLYAHNLIIGEGKPQDAILRVPLDDGTTTTGEAGLFRFNTNLNVFQGYNGTAWGEIGAPTPPGGSPTEIQFHDTGGIFGGDANFTWDKVNKQMVIKGGTDTAVNPPFTITDVNDALVAQISNEGKMTLVNSITNRGFLQINNLSGGIRYFAGPTGEDYGVMALYDNASAIKINLVAGGTQTSFIDTPRGLTIGGQSSDVGAILTMSGDVTSITLPQGDDANRDTNISSPKRGMLRFNIAEDSFEGYTIGKGWGALGGAGYEVFTATHTGGNLNIDLDQGNFQVWTLQADVDSLILANVTNLDFVVVFIQDGTGGHNILAWNGVKTVDGATPDLSLDSNAESFFNFINANGSTYVFGGGKLGAIA